MLDMGEPVRIIDFARQMIKFYGHDETSIPIEIIGMRPGEKKVESLWSEGEHPQATKHPRIIKIDISNSSDENNVEKIINNIRPIICFNPNKKHIFRDQNRLRNIIKDFFPSVVSEK